MIENFVVAGRLGDLVQRWIDSERPVGTVIPHDVILAQGIAATIFYAGYAEIISRKTSANGHEPADADPISADTILTESEWAIIRPLFLLRAELEGALHLEASRGLGVDVYGRLMNEIALEITALEQELPHRAFVHEVLSV